MVTKKDQSSELASELRQAKNYREFLTIYLKNRGQSPSDLARAMKVSRGFPGDVISGRRRITARSFADFDKVLKLPPIAKKLFKLLVAQEEFDLFPEIKKESIDSKIKEIQKKSWISRREVQESPAPQFEEAFTQKYGAVVYAAAGEPGVGASFAQISARTGISDTFLTTTLEKLQAAGLLSVDANTACFVPADLHLFVQPGTNMKALIAKNFQNATENSIQRCAKNLDSQEEFFFSSSVLIKKDRMKDLKEALRKTVLDFVDEAVDPNGDEVVTLLTAFSRS